MKVVKFNNQSLTADSLQEYSTPELVKLYNNVLAKCKKVEQKQVNRFSDKSAGIKRTWAMLQTYAEQHPATPEKAAKVKAVAAVKPEKVKTVSTNVKVARGTNLQPNPQFPVIACRSGSKQAILVDLLSRPGGASMAELLAGLSGGRKPWQEITVRAGFGWDLKRKGYGVESRFSKDEAERFVLTLPEGASIPAHSVSAHAQKALDKAQA